MEGERKVDDYLEGLDGKSGQFSLRKKSEDLEAKADTLRDESLRVKDPFKSGELGREEEEVRGMKAVVDGEIRDNIKKQWFDRKNGTDEETEISQASEKGQE